MTEACTLILYDAQTGHKALTEWAWPWAKAMLIAGHRLTLEIKQETRNTAQNARLHAMLTELSKRVQWHGKSLDVVTWKRLCMAAWLREEGQAVQMIPALDGKGFDVIFERSSKLSKAECARLMEWIDAFAAEQGVTLGINMETGEVFR